MTTPGPDCAGLRCYAHCQMLHSEAMSAVLVDYVTRVQRGDRLASWQARERAWRRWEEFWQSNCGPAAMPSASELIAISGLQDASAYF